MDRPETEKNIAENGRHKETIDKRKRYPGTCPVCGKELWICKSLAMEWGANMGMGSCAGCKTLLSITFNKDNETMTLERYVDYAKRLEKTDGEMVEAF